MTQNPNPPRPVIVGVAPGQYPRILEQAAEFALRFGAELVCVFVDQARLPLSEGPDGSVRSASIDPDLADDTEETFDAGLAAELEHVLKDSGVTWRTLALAGEVSAALGRLAERLDAAMIVVGTHEHSVGGSIQEFFNRSVATHLAHRQGRPVVVIPARSPGVQLRLPRREA
ncbi:universal stress protein [Paeniglutamicibacter sp. NPDC091659]|uniref:universal stress protein n=1 Tax=Paeniglutamicibacter sp. NPDC091659 TaxID=3364389 RepID=UPI0038174935